MATAALERGGCASGLSHGEDRHFFIHQNPRQPAWRPINVYKLLLHSPPLAASWVDLISTARHNDDAKWIGHARRTKSLAT